MNYRQMQRVLKVMRNDGYTTIKLNQKKAILQAELERVNAIIHSRQMMEYNANSVQSRLQQSEVTPITTTNDDLTFGVEIEILSTVDRQTIATALQAEGINAAVEGYNHRVCEGWKIITDSSCGLEVVSPILSGEQGLNQVKKVAETLNRIGCKVDKTCGLHVHIGADALGVKKVKSIVRRWLNNEHHLDSIQPQSRRGNNNYFCASLANTFDASALDHCRTIKTLSQSQCTRYSKLNLQSYRRHQTIEFRHHSGTTDATKITNWIKFLLDFCTTSVNNTEDNGFDALFTSNEIKRFYNSRKAKFERQLATA